MHDRTARLERFQRRLEDRELDGFLVSRPAHLDYLHSFRGSAGVVLSLSGEALLLVDSRYIEQAGEEAVHCRPVLASESILKTLQSRLEALSGGVRRRIGFEASHLTHDWVQRLESWKAPCRWVATTDLIESLRAIKEPSEISALKDAFALAQRAYHRTLPKLREGMEETELAGELELEMRRMGGEGTAFDTIVASGPRSALPHGVASRRSIRGDDLVLIDFGVRLRSYNSDLTRVHLMPQAQPPDILGIVRDAQRAALERVRPGVR